MIVITNYIHHICFYVSIINLILSWTSRTVNILLCMNIRLYIIYFLVWYLTIIFTILKIYLMILLIQCLGP